MLIPTGGPLDHPRLFSDLGAWALLLGLAIENERAKGCAVSNEHCPTGIEIMLAGVEQMATAAKVGA